MTLLVALVALAGDPGTAITLPAASLRIVRVPPVDAELTPAGQTVPAAAATAYLVLSADKLGDADLLRFGELRVPLSADRARVAARFVTSGEPVSGTLRRSTLDVYTPAWVSGGGWICSHAHFDEVAVELPVDGGAPIALTARVEDPAQRTVENRECPRPHDGG
jgi:hypothetical protein